MQDPTMPGPRLEEERKPPLLPGDLMMWILIVSELIVFGAGLAAMLAVRLGDPAGFAAAQDLLDKGGAALNTVVLVTSGLFAALAVRAAEARSTGATRLLLAGASALGLLFLAVKGHEFRGLAASGISTETHAFFMFYYLLTGFHAAHVAAGVLLLGGVGWRCWPAGVEMAAAFWHMVDLVWVLILPVVYLLR
ncbi:cytochrome c oxidase subunit 3 [Rhodobacter sp. NSM]|uniref:cytochrome c oxidase subunit 3 n=1 Tax=Rhodobacter sp. NSM TaxID=3457501 RepID=UPI003FCFB2EB